MHEKSTNSGLLLHCQSHVDNRYKNGVLRTMLYRAHRLSSSWSHFSDECHRQKPAFSRFKHLVSSTIKSFVNQMFVTSSSFHHHPRRQMTRCDYLHRGCEWGSPTSDKGRENITDYKKNEEKITD